MELESLFPLKGEVTESILLGANRGSIYNCPGARTLRQALLDIGVEFPENDLYWGTSTGNIQIDTHLGDHGYEIVTEEKINFFRDFECLLDDQTPFVNVPVTFIITDRW